MRVAPCHGAFSGRRTEEPCDDCGHRLGSHSLATTCDVCDVIAELKLALGVVQRPGL